MTMDVAFNLAVALVGLFGGLWIKRLQSDIANLKRKIELIRDSYVRRADLDRDVLMLKELIQQVQVSIQRIESKLDKKADK